MSDPRASGLPFWARRDTGPVNTYVPGPLPSTPLHNTFDWRFRAIGTAGLLVGFIVLIARSDQSDKLVTCAILVVVWALYAGSSWWKGQAGLRVDADRAEVRRGTTTTSFAGADVDQVRQIYNGRSPDVRLILRDGRRVFIATSRLDRGHSILFEWLRRYAPKANYDAGARRLVDMLRARGLIAPTADEPESGPTAPGPEPDGRTR